MSEPRRRQASAERGLPFSKGLTASSLMVTGLSPLRAYEIANRIQEELIATGQDKVPESRVNELMLDVLRSEAGERYAQAWLKWHSVSELDVPIIILIGGATGVGKSTIATQLATRFGITRVVSTDAVREVLRSALTAEMFPTLYASSFQAGEAVRQPIPHSADRLIIGFREQAAAVAVGARALIERAIREGTDLILEGAHLVPGFLEGMDTDRAAIVSMLVVVEDETLHRSHFFQRHRDPSSRTGDRYLDNFDKIRDLQKYMVSSALMRGVRIISHGDLDTTLSELMEYVIDTALGSSGDGMTRHETGKDHRDVEVVAAAPRKEPTG
jgi:2-phosphoglycerate kinase